MESCEEIRAMKKRSGTKLVKNTPLHVLMVVFLTLFAIIIIYPFYNTILVSLVPQVEYARSPLMLWPTSITWESYEFVMESPLLLRSMGVSAIMMVVGTVYNMLLTVTIACALSKPIPGQ